MRRQMGQTNRHTCLRLSYHPGEPQLAGNAVHAQTQSVTEDCRSLASAVLPSCHPHCLAWHASKMPPRHDDEEEGSSVACLATTLRRSDRAGRGARRTRWEEPGRGARRQGGYAAKRPAACRNTKMRTPRTQDRERAASHWVPLRTSPANPCVLSPPIVQAQPRRPRYNPLRY